ncbi:MAG: HD domain-containing protein [Methylococcaceae bacterium]|nr:HD domain-containing protein [Methylococcaceae bacterium]
MTRIAIMIENPANRRILTETLGDRHKLLFCDGSTVELALQPDVIILDGPSHRKCAPRLKSWRQTAFPAVIPVMLIASSAAASLAAHQLWEDIEDVIHVPIQKAELLARVNNLMKLRALSLEQASRSDSLAVNNRLLEEEVCRKTAALKESFLESVYLLLKAAEYRDEETGNHIERSGHYCKYLASAVGADRNFQETIFVAGPMHDVGKIGIPDAILLKPGRLDQHEWQIMRSHCELGERLLASGTSPYLAMGVEVAGGHHEHWDGSGYPRAIAGEAIPLSARIMALADIYDALRSRRPYKQPMDHATAVALILKGDGRVLPDHFDPTILDAFRREAGTFEQIYATFS